MSDRVSRYLSLAFLYSIALISMAYCVVSYRAYIEQVASQTPIVFSTNLYLLLLPMAFPLLHIAKMSWNAARGENSFQQDGLALLLFLSVLLVAGIVWERHVSAVIKDAGYVECENLRKGGLRSKALYFVAKEEACLEESP